MKDFIVKKGPSIVCLAAYAVGVIGGPIALACDGHWLFAVTVLAVAVFGLPVTVESFRTVFQKPTE